MALSTFSELQTSIANFLDRSDLTSIIPDFITLCESGLNRDLRHWRMENRSESSVTAQYAALPTDWLETIRVHLTGSGTTSLQHISRKDMADRRARYDDQAGETYWFCHTEGALEFFPTPSASQVAQVLYYQRPTALSVSNTSNWLLTYYPDLYLYGSLIHSAPYLKDDERLGIWTQMYQDALAKAQAESDGASSESSGMKVKLRGIAR